MASRSFRPRVARPEAPAPATAAAAAAAAPAANAELDVDAAPAVPVAATTAADSVPDSDLDYNVDSGDDGDEDNITALPKKQTPRPATDVAENKELALLSHFRNLAKEVQGSIILATKYLDEESRRARAWLKQVPVPSEADALSYIPPPPAGWTDEDEEALLLQWQGSQEQQALKEKLDNLTKPLWRTFLRLFQTAPSCLISPQNGLQYCDKLIDGVTPTPNWSHNFSNRLRKLACHGIFHGRVELLHLALLWVAACRSDYRGAIRWHNPSSDILLTDLVKNMRQQDGSKTVKALHSEVRNAYGPKGPASAMSDLLRGIEKRAFPDKIAVPPPTRPEAIEILDISASDLRVVKKAANAVKCLGFPAYHSMAMSSRAVANALGTAQKDYPSTDADMYRVREAAALSVQRFQARPVHEPTDETDDNSPDSAKDGVRAPATEDSDEEMEGNSDPMDSDNAGSGGGGNLAPAGTMYDPIDLDDD
ncbi:hypothetical protein PGQ11_001514 [Apiospora arundinis]|uniref:Uncharacterized protein n=1 Tax=Apiospora arundinis TaxID=335852 RepID=A0ABR2JQE6_9PEZI